MKTLFTITPEEYQKLVDDVNKGLYLKKSKSELPVTPQTTDASQIDKWRKDYENRLKLLGEENEMLRKRCERIELIDKMRALYEDEQRSAQGLVGSLKKELDARDKKISSLTHDVDSYKQRVDQALEEKKRFEQKNKMLEKDHMAIGRQNDTLIKENNLLKEKVSEFEALFASGFAGAAVVESGEGTKVVDSDAARENEAYKKEIEEKEALINELSNKLKNKAIPMSLIIEGFRKLAQIDSKDAVASVFKSLCTMFSKCAAWTNNEDEILRIFVEQNTKPLGSITNYYAAGANHYDHHRELNIKDDDKKLLK